MRYEVAIICKLIDGYTTPCLDSSSKQPYKSPSKKLLKEGDTGRGSNTVLDDTDTASSSYHCLSRHVAQKKVMKRRMNPRSSSSYSPLMSSTIVVVRDGRRSKSIMIDAEAAEEDRKASSSKSNVIDILMA